ncbi:MAG: hypothetical protein JW746_02350 [Candidatus Krumholzibacteriota bacterium]|nr:hypothetical protein [Candidatus Krumholzibacteriota bacterium]
MSRWKIVGPWTLTLVFSLYLAIFAGCNDNPVDGDTVSPELETLEILCHDLSPLPDSLARLTVLVEGVSPGNTWPTYTWEADGGSFPYGNTGISVEWKAPSETGIYEVSVRGTLDGVADTISKYVMVRNFEEINTGKNFSCSPVLVSNILYFFGGSDGLSPRSTVFKGFHCYRYGSPGVSSLISETGETVGGGYGLRINPIGRSVSGSFHGEYFPSLLQQRLDVWIFPLLFGTDYNITNDDGGVNLRRNQHVNPGQNQAGDNVVWEARIVGTRPDGTEDLSKIGFWDKPTNQKVYVTQSHDSFTVLINGIPVVTHRYYNNIKPTIVPAGDAMVYFVDTTGVFEPCKMNIGDFPVISSRVAMGGIFNQARIKIDRTTVFIWNKTFELLGFVSLGGKLCFVDYRNNSVTVASGIEGIQEFAWSPDDTECAVVNEEGIWIVSAAGVVSNSPVYVKERATDGIFGVNWSPNIEDPKIGFRMVRKGKTVEDSYSALVLCMLDSDTGEWMHVYASRSVNWTSSYEPNVDYLYMKVFFTSEEVMYVPFPTPPWSGDPLRRVECTIFRSFE